MDATPDEIHRIPAAGGASEPLAIEGNYRIVIVGTDATHLYFAGRPVPTDIAVDAGGYYRLPLGGGAPERIIEGYVPAPGLFTQLVARADDNLFWELDAVHRIPHGSGEATLLLTTGCEIHAFAADGADMYLSIFDDSDDSAYIVRVPAP